MVSTDEREPAEPPIAGDETSTLLGSLERVRSFLGWKCGGLDGAGIRTTAAASTITLGGLLKHLAFVEDDHFATLWLGRAVGAPWDAFDRDDPDWHWRVAEDETPEGLMTMWRDAVARSRAIVDDALAHGDLDQRGRFVDEETGESPNLRRILIDLIEEYARHAGHADLIRESIDGLVGEDPPGPIPV
jgi:hypothetical protein